MKVIRSIQEMKDLVHHERSSQKTIGFVPTMGFLHEGHLTLVNEAVRENHLIVMSIFVNPTQFGPGEDYEIYPRNEKRDAELAKEAGVDVLFIPDVEEMYPTKTSIQIIPGNQKDVLCGRSRPTHFNGVLQVILKLFNIVTPTNAYFGMKDAQQLAIIETFMNEYNFDTKIRRIPTVREADGLAKSSRNVHLTEQERQEAPIIFEALQLGKKIFLQTHDEQKTIQTVRSMIQQKTSGAIDYISLLSYPYLDNLEKNCTNELILACAVKFSNTRLIDNVIFSKG